MVHEFGEQNACATISLGVSVDHIPGGVLKKFENPNETKALTEISSTDLTAKLDPTVPGGPPNIPSMYPLDNNSSELDGLYDLGPQSFEGVLQNPHSLEHDTGSSDRIGYAFTNELPDFPYKNSFDSMKQTNPIQQQQFNQQRMKNHLGSDFHHLDVPNAVSQYISEPPMRTNTYDTQQRTDTYDEYMKSSDIVPGGFVYQVYFKRSHNYFLLQTGGDQVRVGDYVKVEADRGENLGIIGDLIPAERFWAIRYAAISKKILKYIIRHATQEERFNLIAKTKDEDIVTRTCHEILVTMHPLPIIIVDAEFQYDRNKLTIYHNSKGRVDFREFVRSVFAIFKTRIWMQLVESSRGSKNRITTSTYGTGSASSPAVMSAPSGPGAGLMPNVLSGMMQPSAPLGPQHYGRGHTGVMSHPQASSQRGYSDRGFNQHRSQKQQQRHNLQQHQPPRGMHGLQSHKEGRKAPPQNQYQQQQYMSQKGPEAETFNIGIDMPPTSDSNGFNQPGINQPDMQQLSENERLAQYQRESEKLAHYEHEMMMQQKKLAQIKSSMGREMGGPSSQQDPLPSRASLAHLE